MKQKMVRIIATLAILFLLLQTSPIQARPTLTLSEAPSQRVESTVDQLLPEGLTSSEWQSIQNQIMANLSQQVYLKASNTDMLDYFGFSVAISGDTLVVGAPYEDSNAIGGQDDDSAVDSGAAYVFVHIGAVWTQQAYLKSSNTDGYDFFGHSVAVSGDTLVVGAPGEDSNTTDGQDNDSATDSGAAYVFVRNGTTWTQQAYLKASNTDAGDYFGYSLSISGDTLVVGAPYEDSKATDVNGDQNDNTESSSGAAYVFVRSGTAWSQQAYLKASNTDAGDYFGYSLSISGERLIVGAYDEDSSATDVNGDENNNDATASGAAYVFVRSSGTWTQQAYLKASNTQAYDEFGHSVAISKDTLVIGAPGEASIATDVNGDENNNDATASGAAYVFVRSGSTWSQEAYLKASNTDPADAFGWSVAISEDTLIVGAREESSSATGVNQEQDNNEFRFSGAAYVFVRRSGSWSQAAYLKASNTNAEDRFGYSVAISGDTLIVGARDEDSNAIGVNQEQINDSAPDSGAAYVFDITHYLFLPLVTK